MGRYLIVANQTLGGAELEEKVRDRIEHGEGRFYVVVPMVEPENEVGTGMRPDSRLPAPAGPESDTDALEQARERSEHRLRAMVDKITALGGEADGEVGTTDPFKAVEAVLDREAFDEVIISTLPAGISRWVKLDLASRVDRKAQCLVTTVEAGR